MKLLYFDCSMGAAGDMLSASLFELLNDKEKEEFIEKMNSLNIPDTKISAERTVKCGICGTHMLVKVGGISEDEHIHEHHHGHRHLKDIEDIILSFPLSEKVKKDALNVYEIIAFAEGKVHGTLPGEVHFHEVGTMDAIADVTSVCLLMEMINPDKVVSSPLCTGFGHVHCAHGILPVPAPATLNILEGVTVYSGDIEGELCTPTGAALLKYFVSDYCTMPVMKVLKTGYGMGTKDFEKCNCVRALLGDVDEKAEEIAELTFNVDDMTAEKIGFLMDILFEKGALEVYTVPVGMKKSRPGTMICIMCRYDIKDEIMRLVFKHTTTLGIRENISNRYSLERRIERIDTRFGNVAVKVSNGFGITKEKLEYEDIAEIARKENLSIDEVIKIINADR